jgi:uncharacterized membrane protein HdeD (DUF308 family)
LFIFIAVWALVTGIFEIFASVHLRKIMSHEWVLTLAGVLLILLALFCWQARQTASWLPYG